MTDDERAKRIHGIVYSCEDREELAERIVGLEELVRDVLHFAAYSPRPRTTDESVRVAHELFELDVRAHELGVDE